MIHTSEPQHQWQTPRWSPQWESMETILGRLKSQHDILGISMELAIPQVFTFGSYLRLEKRLGEAITDADKYYILHRTEFYVPRTGNPDSYCNELDMDLLRKALSEAEPKQRFPEYRSDIQGGFHPTLSSIQQLYKSEKAALGEISELFSEDGLIAVKESITGQKGWYLRQWPKQRQDAFVIREVKIHFEYNAHSTAQDLAQALYDAYHKLHSNNAQSETRREKSGILDSYEMHWRRRKTLGELYGD